MEQNNNTKMDHETQSNNTPEIAEPETTTANNNNNNNVNPPPSAAQRKVSWTKLRRVDSFNMEAGNVSSKPWHHHATNKGSWNRTMRLALQSIGVIYGDIGTSPLYVYSSTFTDGIKHNDDILGVLSLIIYTIVLIPMIKYVFLVLWANDNGDGGTFALYSLICRYANVGMIPNNQPEDRELSNYRLDTPNNQLRRAQKIKEKLEKSKTAKIFLFLITILGTSMVIGDGVLTPCISVLSAVGGISSLSQDGVVGISIAILIVLFCAQRFGTDKVGYTFAPAITLWFLCISGIGLYNLFKYEPGVLKAINPKYIIDYFNRNGKKAWVSLGGVVLCITGTEAMFADLGHFNVAAVQISFTSVLFPSVLLSYIGQAAYLRKFPSDVAKTFYASIPNPIYWPTFVVANVAAVIASQAMISGAFAIISQSLSLGCFPRVKIIHTSSKYEGQVYIPEINYLLMVACVFVTLKFRTTDKIGNAYGIAVVAVMLITTCLVTLIMLMIWKTSIWWISLFFVVYMSLELLFFSAVLYKFTQGGYLPLALSAVLMIVMGIWHYAHVQRYVFELKNKVSSSYIRDLSNNRDITRIPGIGLLYSELVQGIPPIFHHFISNVPSIHSIIVMVSIKNIPISKVALEERFFFRQVEPREYRIYRCVVRYGYKDLIEEPNEFEKQLVENLKEFIRHEYFILESANINDDEDANETSNNLPHSGLLLQDHANTRKSNSSSLVCAEESLDQNQQISRRVSSGSIQSVHTRSENNYSNRIVPVPLEGVEAETQFVQKAMDQGVFYLLGEAEVVAKRDSSYFKKFVINYGYTFLRKNFRQGEKTLAIPKARLLRVGMTYEI